VRSAADNEVAAETDPITTMPSAESDEGETDVPEFYRGRQGVGTDGGATVEYRRMPRPT
jgi:hypothetical protein